MKTGGWLSSGPFVLLRSNAGWAIVHGTKVRKSSESWMTSATSHSFLPMFSPVGRKKLAGHGEGILLLSGVETDRGLCSGFPAY